MREFKASTKQGQNIINRANNYEGYYLSDVYDRYSSEKATSYNWCFEQYSNDVNAHNFHICSHNTFQYSVAWETVIDNEPALRVETANNTFIVWLNR